DAVRGRLDDQIRGLLGANAAHAIQELVQNAQANSSTGMVATILSIAALIFGATGVFGELQDSLNTIWEVKPKPGRGLRGILRDPAGEARGAVRQRRAGRRRGARAGGHAAPAGARVTAGKVRTKTANGNVRVAALG